MSWAHYMLQVNLYLIVFFCFYKLLLDKETYFTLNRVYLMASGILSLAIPFLRFEWLTTQPVSQQVYTSVDQLSGFVAEVSVITKETEKFNWGDLIVAVYVCGILFCIGRFAFRLIALRKIFSKNKAGTAFSFLNKKVIAAGVPEPATIDVHEEIHIQQKHSIDVLFYETLAIFTWFNPVIYAYKYAIKNIHEYLADEAAANFQGDKEAYSLLLLSRAFGTNPSNLTNGFFSRSLIKKRIFMLHKQRSKKVAILKYGLFVPLFALTLILSSATVRKNDQLMEVADRIPLDHLRSAMTTTFQAPGRIVDAVIGTDLRFTASSPLTLSKPSAKAWTSFYTYLGDRIAYPKQALENQMQGDVRISFNVETGKIVGVHVTGGLDHSTKEEIKGNVLSFDKKIPVEDGNYSLITSFNLPESAKLPEIKVSQPPAGYNELPKIVISANMPGGRIEETVEVNAVYTAATVNQSPNFPGGIGKFYDYIGRTVKYPTEATEHQIQGTVFASFIVEKDGSITDIDMGGRKLGYGLEEEAHRVIAASKRWNPGMHNGRAVRVRYSIPIRFALPQEVITVKTPPIATRSNLVFAVKNMLKGSKIESIDEALFIIDGKKSDWVAFNRIKPEHIETVTVIKDASGVGEYGEEAANGAIVIDTKNKNKSLDN